MAAVAEAVGTEFLEYGWSAHELPVLAAILTVASDLADGTVVDIAGRLTLAGVLCFATLPALDVLALRATDEECAALSAVVAANTMDMTVDRQQLKEQRIADQFDAFGAQARVIIVDIDNSVSVLLSAQRSIRSERTAIIVPTCGASGGIATKTRNLLQREGYVGYRLSPSPRFHPRRSWSNPPRSLNPYVMLCPGPIDDGFRDRFDWWFEELAAALPDRRSNIETGERIRRAYQLGGLRQALRVGISAIHAGSGAEATLDLNHRLGHRHRNYLRPRSHRRAGLRSSPRP